MTKSVAAIPIGGIVFSNLLLGGFMRQGHDFKQSDLDTIIGEKRRSAKVLGKV